MHLADGHELPVGGVRAALSRRFGLRRPRQPDRLAATQLLRQCWPDVYAGQMCDRDADIQYRDARILERAECVDADCVLEAERSVTRPAEPAEQPSGVERLAEVGSEHSLVGSLPRGDEQLRFGDGAGPEVEQLDGMNRRGTGQTLHLLALACQLIQVTPLMAHSRMHRRHLGYGADDRPEGILT